MSTLRNFLQGPIGRRGRPGEIGKRGPRGATGINGIGVLGATGPAGLDGPIGATGAIGPTGSIGPVGANLVAPIEEFESDSQSQSEVFVLAPDGFTLLDTNNGPINAYLPDGDNGTLKFINLDPEAQATVGVSGANFYLSKNLPSRIMIYANNKWQIISDQYSSFFPQVDNYTGLSGPDNIGRSEEGTSVALSADGTVLVAGGPHDNDNVGASWVYTKTNGMWDQGVKLVGLLTGSSQGYSVAISADGNTIATGAPDLDNDNEGTGATYIFNRSGSEWSSGIPLVGTAVNGPAHQGTAVALSTDGQTVAFGGYGDNNDIGAFWVFANGVSGWTAQATEVTGDGYTGTSLQGYSIALSADGDTLALGGREDNNIGATWIFTRDKLGNWTQQGPKLVGTGYIDFPQQGSSVALSADGNTLAVGGPGDDDNSNGATWIFTRSNGVWSQQGDKLSSRLINDNYSRVAQGSFVALSADGNTLAVTGNYYGPWIYTRANGVWTEQITVNTQFTSLSIFVEQFAVALSADGSSLAVGDIGANDDKGAVYVFD